MKRLLALTMVLVCLLCACADAPSSSSEPEGIGGSTTRDPVPSGERQFSTPATGAPIVVMQTSRGVIRFVLFPESAPLAVENFCTLAQQGYYNGTEFHRVLREFIIQGGDAGGTGLAGESIWDAPFATERSDTLRHYSGALCMAAMDGKVDSHLSQFYVVATPQGNLDEAALARLRAAGVREEVVETYRQAGGAPYLDNTDTVFGQVLSGMDVVDAIVRVALDEDGRPKTPVTIESVSIDSYVGTAGDGQPSSAPASSQTSAPGSDVSQPGSGAASDTSHRQAVRPRAARAEGLVILSAMDTVNDSCGLYIQSGFRRARLVAKTAARPG